MADPPSQTTDKPRVEMRGLDSFCVELLTGIFLCLPYRSLLSVLAVCTEWKSIVMEDPSLSVEIFKSASEKYVEPGCREISKYGFESRVYDAWEGLYRSYMEDPKYLAFKEHALESSDDSLLAAWHKSSQNPEVAKVLLHNRSFSLPERVRLHPAIPEISYVFGCGKEKVGFFVRDRSEDCHTDYPYRRIQLSQLEIANDFISIPAVTKAVIDVRAFMVILENPKGITLMNLFDGFVKESTRKLAPDIFDIVFKTQKVMAHFLGDHLHYEGLYTVTRTGNCLTAEVFLGS
ncbi:hypothetical protein R3P38DRAFT_2885289 [Favolaschia claudopus]|uniref:F-box domain-containing protein n=1 Tax=Favolaschia claudopus TaxID=2862362 RepID=A0AAW0CYY9_9AGAR